MRFCYILALISSASIANAALNASYVLIQREPRNRLWPVGAYSYPPPTRARRSIGPSPVISNGPLDARPTPDPTGDPSSSTTVHINDEHDFALILPNKPGELISEAEADGVAYCSPGGDPAECEDKPSFSDSFVLAVAISKADDDSWIQITGCINSNASSLDPSDAGGQFDVRYPNGAQCTFGGYGASFIQLVEPALGRFCLRCCASSNDQVNCNSHQDRMGCMTAIPGTYDFPDLGISCSS